MLDPTTFTVMPCLDSIPVDVPTEPPADPAYPFSRCTRPIEPVEAPMYSSAGSRMPLDVHYAENHPHIPQPTIPLDDPFAQDGTAGVSSFLTGNRANWLDNIWQGADFSMSEDLLQTAYTGPDGLKGVTTRGVAARRRTGQACDSCRDRKAKCSGERPVCERCANRGLLCNYNEERTMRIRRAARDRHRVSVSSTSQRYSPYRRPVDMDGFPPRTVSALPSFTIDSSSQNPCAPSDSLPPLDPVDLSPFYSPKSSSLCELSWSQGDIFSSGQRLTADRENGTEPFVLASHSENINESFSPGPACWSMTSASSSVEEDVLKELELHAAIVAGLPTVATPPTEPSSPTSSLFDSLSPSIGDADAPSDLISAPDHDYLETPSKTDADGMGKWGEGFASAGGVTPRTEAFCQFVDAIGCSSGDVTPTVPLGAQSELGQFVVEM